VLNRTEQRGMQQVLGKNPSNAKLKLSLTTKKILNNLEILIIILH
jgi:hypothetical protein